MTSLHEVSCEPEESALFHKAFPLIKPAALTPMNGAFALMDALP
jgi:hypothetical protein